ncbi:hypothetical protein F511_11946 [Dorcoceras hygrometricum]|uniref:Uncharacterized protein n=1 Tax=Dorcoceras hygrometricum TaxID=472368 RepID=A0A2Z7BLP2_9LAMI|nr:hypothetical protein F511_11946 [Dorcoceras hygrometricum]
MGVIALFVCLLVVNAGQTSCSAKRIRRRLIKLQRRVLMLLLVAAGGNPGFTAGRGFNPAGGAPRGG